jgi:hypothetical protein
LTEEDVAENSRLAAVKTSSVSASATTRLNLTRRPRRLRRTEAIRSLVRETRLTPDVFVYPLFVCEGRGVTRSISSMPGVSQLSVDEAVREAEAAAAEAARMAREKEEQAARAAALEAEQKAKRDARYAARKGRGGTGSGKTKKK